MKHIFLLSLILLFFTACEESPIEQYRSNPQEFSNVEFWKETSNAKKVLSTAYTYMQGRKIYSMQLSHPLTLMSHEADLDWIANADRNEFNNNQFTVYNVEIRDLWNGFYKCINVCNDLINHHADIKPTAEYTQEIIDDWVGQAYFIRGLAYHHLAGLWSEKFPAQNPNALSVPIITKVPDSEEEFYPKRETVEHVYQQIESDYKMAIQLLKDGTKKGNDRGMANKYAAIGFLGKTYLFWEKYDLAKIEFEKIIDSKLYSLVDKVEKNWNADNEFNSESIMEWEYSEASLGFAGPYAEEGTWSIWPMRHGPAGLPGNWFGNQFVHDKAIERFGSDPRLQASVVLKGELIYNGTFRNSLYNHTRKFWSTTRKEEINATRGTTYNIVALRLADVYLMYAEVLQAKGNESLAMEYMNKIRRRAYSLNPEIAAPAVDYNVSGIALRDSIREERWREFLYEMHNWYDFRRWGIVAQEMAKVGVTRTTTALKYTPQSEYLPIPSIEVERNPNCPQSEGYK